MSVSNPDLARVPEDPRRRFLRQLHLLYDSSGRPSARRISAVIRQNNSLPDTVSHETVAAVLRGDLIPSWSKVECIVTSLGDWSINKYDRGVLLRHFHGLWLDTVQARETVIDGIPGAAIGAIHTASSPVVGAAVPTPTKSQCHVD